MLATCNWQRATALNSWTVAHKLRHKDVRYASPSSSSATEPSLGGQLQVASCQLRVATSFNMSALCQLDVCLRLGWGKRIIWRLWQQFAHVVPPHSPCTSFSCYCLSPCGSCKWTSREAWPIACSIDWLMFWPACQTLISPNRGRCARFHVLMSLRVWRLPASDPPQNCTYISNAHFGHYQLAMSKLIDGRNCCTQIE